MFRKTALTLIVAVALSAALSAQNGVPEGAVGQAPTPPAVGTAAPQQLAPPPVLTDAQKLQIQNAALLLENWQLKTQQAAGEFEKARAAMQQLIAAMTPAGYQLTDKLEFVKTPDPKKEPGKQ